MVAGLIGAGISALGSVGGALASNALSSFQMQEMAKYQAALNYKYAKKSALNSPSWNRQGLVKADYNPMLALGNMSGATSNWTTPANPTTPDMSNIGSNAMDKLLAVKQQDNQDKMTESQVQVNNADTKLKEQQTLTETFEQTQKQVHADLERIESQLKRKDLDYYDKKYLLWEKHMNTEIERMNTQNRVDIMNAQSNEIQAGASMVNAGANSRDVESKIKQRDYQNSGYDLDNLYKGMWLSPDFKPNFYNYGLNGMQKHPYK